MGMFFSNIHIKKTDDLNINDLKAMLISQMNNKGYMHLDSAEGSEVLITMYHSNTSEWITIASDDFMFRNAEETKAAVVPFSDKFGTYVIAAACSDSDYLMMNIINTSDDTDGWVNIGDNYGMPFPRRTSLAPWKKVVSDHEKFKALMKEDYVFAEDAFYGAAELLGMDVRQCSLDTVFLDDEGGDRLIIMYFKLPDGDQKELPLLKISCFDLMPCRIGESHCVFVKNRGGRSRGIAIQFEGNYIENDQLVFENVTFEYRQGNEFVAVPIELKKICAKSGEYVLFWSDKDFNIPPAVNPEIPLMKREDLEFERAFGVRFTVRGDAKKVLDVKVFIIPLENYKGSDCWYVFRHFGTKRKYIEYMNEHHIRIAGRRMLDPDDYDLEDQ